MEEKEKMRKHLIFALSVLIALGPWAQVQAQSSEKSDAFRRELASLRTFSVAKLVEGVVDRMVQEAQHDRSLIFHEASGTPPQDAELPLHFYCLHFRLTGLEEPDRVVRPAVEVIGTNPQVVGGCRQEDMLADQYVEPLRERLIALTIGAGSKKPVWVSFEPAVEGESDLWFPIRDQISGDYLGICNCANKLLAYVLPDGTFVKLFEEVEVQAPVPVSRTIVRQTVTNVTNNVTNFFNQPVPTLEKKTGGWFKWWYALVAGALGYGIRVLTSGKEDLPEPECYVLVGGEIQKGCGSTRERPIG